MDTGSIPAASVIPPESSSTVRKTMFSFEISQIALTSQGVRFALRWHDVDFENNRIFISSAYVRGQLRNTKTKSEKREVTLQPQANEALLNQQAFTEKQNETVFHDPCTHPPWRNDQPIRKKIWIPALKQADIKYRNPCQTRHTFASMMLSKGKHYMWVASQMGRKDWGMIIKVYGRWIAQSK